MDVGVSPCFHFLHAVNLAGLHHVASSAAPIVAAELDRKAGLDRRWHAAGDNRVLVGLLRAWRQVAADVYLVSRVVVVGAHIHVHVSRLDDGGCDTILLFLLQANSCRVFGERAGRGYGRFLLPLSIFG